MEPGSHQNRVVELQDSGHAIGRLAADPEAFRAAVAAFRAQDAERFQSVVAAVGLLGSCQLVCRWICSKHCVFVCRAFCGPIDSADELDVDEMLEFARETERLAQDEALLSRLLDALDHEDVEAWKELIASQKLQRFCHQLCHWLCGVRCRLACSLLCPPPPLITKVAFIPTDQINTQGLGAGPSIPPGTTPPDDKPAGDGDHPFGGLAHIEGNFLSVAGATAYKVEWAPATSGPWTAILTPMDDLRLVGVMLVGYTRVPDAAGWYSVSDIGLLGPTQLTDWPTPSPDGLYFLRLTAKNGGGTEFASALVPVLVDNTSPVGPAPGNRPSITITQGGTVLDCCATVTSDGGPLTITVIATDANFGVLGVDLEGGCGVSVPIYSKAYNGNLADTGAPAPGIDIPWDPWTAGVDPCCYVMYVRIWDRAIVSNSYAGRHGNSNWQAITIA
jgi:hypothetical protein